MNIVLISTYELGHQPFGLASPTAWLRARGHIVHTIDAAILKPSVEEITRAEIVGFYLPMHTATRLALPLIRRVRELNPAARLCAFGLYAPLAEEYLRELGVTAFFGGEFEPALAHFADTLSATSLTSLERLQFLKPDRSGMPPLSKYARLVVGDDTRVVGYTEASRGCKHQCRHCPIVPVYRGTFRIVQADVVLADVEAQVQAGAEHITFGDPDFLNGPAHAIRLVERMHKQFPSLTYDVTAKIEHLLKHQHLLPLLAETGCAFVTSAVESLDDEVLTRLDKGHTRTDFLRVVELFRQTGLNLAPTFIPFTPWATRNSCSDLLHTIAECDLIENVAPVQLTLRLLVPHGSRLLELEEIRRAVTTYNPEILVWEWKHPDPQIDTLASRALKVVNRGIQSGASRREIFADLWTVVHDAPFPRDRARLPRTVIPYLEEPWFC